MEETAEPIAAADLTLLAIADDVQTRGWIRRLQPECPVRTMTVVVVDIDPKHTLHVPWPTITSQSRHSARAVPIHRSA
jgi:sulfur transfer complex TusBCD TusB component (DsrH family)